MEITNHGRHCRLTSESLYFCMDTMIATTTSESSPRVCLPITNALRHRRTFREEAQYGHGQECTLQLWRYRSLRTVFRMLAHETICPRHVLQTYWSPTLSSSSIQDLMPFLIVPTLLSYSSLLNTSSISNSRKFLVWKLCDDFLQTWIQ